FGIGVNVPYGLKTEYDSDWLGRFQAIKSKVETYNVNPVISWEPTKTLTVGAGVSFQRLNAELTNRVNFAAAFAQGLQRPVAGGLVPPPAASTLIGSAAPDESVARAQGDRTRWGRHAGGQW